MSYFRVRGLGELSELLQQSNEELFGLAEHPGGLGDEQPQEHSSHRHLTHHLRVHHLKVLGQLEEDGRGRGGGDRRRAQGRRGRRNRLLWYQNCFTIALTRPVRSCTLAHVIHEDCTCTNYFFFF